jgi:hypothetical protein
MQSVHDWQSYQASVLAQLGGGTAILYRPCREHPTRVTDCSADDSVKDHDAIAVISGPGLTGLFLFVFPTSSLSGCPGYLVKSAFADEKSLFVKSFSGSVPAEYLFQEMPADNDHGLIAGHLGNLLLVVVIFPVETTSPDQGQGYCQQDFAQQPPALFTDFVLSLKCSTLPCLEVKTGVAHELAEGGKIRERSCFGKQSGKVLFRDNLRRRWRNQWIVLPQFIQYCDHLFGDLLFSLQNPEIIIEFVVEILFQHLHICPGQVIQHRACGIVPQAFQRTGSNTRRLLSHLPAKDNIAIFNYPVWITAILHDQGKTGIAVQKIFFKRIITEELNQQLADPAAMAGNGDIAFIVYFMELSEHKILFSKHAELDDLVQLAQGIDDPGIFFIGFVIVVTLHYAKLCHRLGIDVTGEKTKPPGGSHKLVLILPGRFADDPQSLPAVFFGNGKIGEQSLLNNSCAVGAGIEKLIAIDFKEKTQRVSVDIHGYINNSIEVDFLGSSRNLHNGFSFGFDSISCERQYSHCTSTLKGEALLLAA